MFQNSLNTNLDVIFLLMSLMEDLRFRTTEFCCQILFWGKQSSKDERHFFRDTPTARDDFQQIFNYL